MWFWRKSRRTGTAVRQHALPAVAIFWMLLALASALLLHTVHLPLWLWSVTLFSVGWRWQVYRGRLSYPGSLIKTAAVVVATLGVVFSFDKTFSLESAAAFLVAASTLKLLEMKDQRDGHILVFLSYFLLAVGFLFEQGILAGVLGIVAVWLITSALVALQQRSRSVAGIDAARIAARLLLASLPFMLVMYLVFPRFGPLWSVGLQSSAAKTGLSDQMAPGDIASLSQSDELAFRVSFKDGLPPPRQQWYWRALILDHYDGRRWQPGLNPAIEWYSQKGWRPPADADGVLHYEVIQEPTDQKWLFAMRGVAAVNEQTGMTEDDRLVHRRKVRQRLRYDVLSWPEVTLDEAGLSPLIQRQTTRFPAHTNPRAQQWARQLLQQSGSEQAFIAALLQHFREQAFYYTLKPPALGENDIDAFLFDTRRGFCAHYSGALTFLARAAGIPARVVVGYQGGEWNADEQYLTVRQYDAHAWVEVWYAGQGWTRVDPTAAVSPARIEFGLEQAVADEGTFLEDQVFSTHRLKSVGWLNRLRLEWDSLNYYWQRWVLSYDKQRQQTLFNQWLGVRSYETLLYGLALAFAVFFLLAALWLWWSQRPKASSRELRAWLSLQKKAARLGVEAQTGETPACYLQRLARAFPQQQAQIQALERLLIQAFYAQTDGPDKVQQRLLAAAISRLRRAL